MNIQKTFPTDKPVPQYMLIAANGSVGFIYSDEEMQTMLDMYERLEVETRIYELKETPA